MMFAARNPECPHLFQRHGKRVKSFRSAFENARARVRLARLLPDPMRAKIAELTQAQLLAFDRVPDAEAIGIFERALREKLTAKQISEAVQDCVAKPPNLMLFHDQRRTAVTNMIREGVPEKQALAVSGHLDPSILRRHLIVEEQDVKYVAQHDAAFLRQRDLARAAQSEGLCNELCSEEAVRHPAAFSPGSSKVNQ